MFVTLASFETLSFSVCNETESVQINSNDRKIVVSGYVAARLRLAWGERAIAYGNKDSGWSRITWRECVADLLDDIRAAECPVYAAWRDAALALGWTILGDDPVRRKFGSGPCLHHADLERSWPLCDWRGAVKDLGYSSPEEAMADLAA